MIFGGIETCSLVDWPGHVAITLFTRGCNLDCGYCHNRELLSLRGIPEIPEEFIFEFVKKRSGKIGNIVITGGEPLYQKELPSFLERLKEMNFQIKLDTNGCFPNRLKAVLELGLVDFVSLDIKASPKKYEKRTNRSKVFSKVMQSLNYLQKSEIAFEMRTTFEPDLSKEEWLEILEFTPKDIPHAMQAYRPVDGYLQNTKNLDCINQCKAIGLEKNHSVFLR